MVFANDFKAEVRKQGDVLNIGVILLCYKDNYDSNYKNMSLLKNYLKKAKKDYKLNFIVFYNNDGLDANYYLELAEKLKIKDYDVVEVPFRFNDIKHILLNQDIVISMRYHGSLLSNMLGMPTLTLIDEKHRHYYNKMNYLNEHYSFANNRLTTQLTNDDLESLMSMKKSIVDNKAIAEKAYDEINKALELIKE